MNKRMLSSISLTLTLVALGTASAQTSGAGAELPNEIAAYYSGMNFIAVSSTPAERTALTGGRAFREFPDIDPERRAALLAAMDAVERAEAGWQPEMPNPFDGRGRGMNRWTGSIAYSLPEVVNVSERKIVLSVRRYHFDPRSLNVPADGGSSPGRTPGNPGALFGEGVLTGLEQHSWILTDAGWKRLPVMYVLVGE